LIIPKCFFLRQVLLLKGTRLGAFVLIRKVETVERQLARLFILSALFLVGLWCGWELSAILE
jgi:hypothetical protein